MSFHPTINLFLKIVHFMENCAPIPTSFLVYLLLTHLFWMKQGSKLFYYRFLLLYKTPLGAVFLWLHFYFIAVSHLSRLYSKVVLSNVVGPLVAAEVRTTGTNMLLCVESNNMVTSSLLRQARVQLFTLSMAVVS